MSNALTLKIENLTSTNKKVFIPFVTISDPDVSVFKNIINILAECGVDAIEIGIPYSDPLGDGPILQASYQRVLRGVNPSGINPSGVNPSGFQAPGINPSGFQTHYTGFSLKTLPSIIENIKRNVSIPLIIMSYYNPIFNYGLKNFFQDISNAGVEGILISDLPPEEWKENLSAAQSFNLETIFLITPVTPAERMQQICLFSSPFIYCVSRTGVTGVREALPVNIQNFLKQVKMVSQKPIIVGFGISTPEQAKMVSNYADGVIVGSAIVKIVEQNLHSTEDMYKEVKKFVMSLRTAV